MPVASALETWTREAESLENRKNLLYFRQQVGLKFDKQRLASLEQKTKAHYTRYLRSKLGAGGSRRLFLMSVSTVGAALTYKQFLRLHETRSKKIVSREFKFGGAPVNWGSWRQFAASTDDSAARKKLFDDFIEKSEVLAPIIQQRFENYRSLLAEFGTDPHSTYLEHEGIQFDALVAMVQHLGELAKGPLHSALGRYSAEILGRPAEYYDDFYYFRNRVFRRYAKHFPTRVRPISKIVRTMRNMGLDASRILVDDIDRKGKSASAFCYAIKVPADVRISYRKANPLEDYSAVFHEFGHGIHFSSIDRRASFVDRYWVASGVAEIFSIFFEGLIHERTFLIGELGLPEGVADDIVGRFRFNQLFFAAFYAANSTMKLRYWHDTLPFESLDELYSDLTERFLGIRYPGAYWKLHHVMPDYFLYSPSYLIAAVRAFELRNVLASRFGDRYWDARGAGEMLLSLMRPGQSLDLSFSALDESAYVGGLAAAS